MERTSSALCSPSRRPSKDSANTLIEPPTLSLANRPSNGFIDDSFWSRQSRPTLDWALPCGEEHDSDRASSKSPQVTQQQEPQSDEQHHATLALRPDQPGVVVRIGTGSGQFETPFSISRDDIVALFKELDFSSRFLRRLNGRISMFEHLFSCRHGHKRSSSFSQTPDTLEIALSTFETNGFHCFGTYDLKKRQGRYLVFVKESTPLSPEWTLGWLQASADVLSEFPFLLPNVIMAGVQKHVHNYVAWRVAVNEMEAQIGVTADKRGLEKRGYTAESSDLDQVNNHLSTLKKAVADQRLTVGTIFEHAKAYLRIIELCETLERKFSADVEMSQPREELHGSIVRAEIYLQYLRTIEDILQNHTAALYNRISQHESSLNLAAAQSMKTIAVMTLVALPPTFIATLFSTSIFDSMDASMQWQLLVGACLAVWLVTLTIWILWYRWGNQWTRSVLHTANRAEAALFDRLRSKGLSHSDA